MAYDPDEMLLYVVRMCADTLDIPLEILFRVSLAKGVEKGKCHTHL